MARPIAVGPTYLKLVKAFPLQSIRGDADLDAATVVLHDLLRQELDAGGQAYLDALTDLVEAYESRAHPIPPASEAEVIRLLMESNGLTQGQFAERVGVVQSTVSAVMKGGRSLTREQVAAVSAAFNVSPAAFFPPAPGGEAGSRPILRPAAQAAAPDVVSAPRQRGKVAGVGKPAAKPRAHLAKAPGVRPGPDRTATARE